MDKKDWCPLLMTYIVDRDSNKCSRYSRIVATLSDIAIKKCINAVKKCSGDFADIETYSDLAFEKASAGG